MQDHLQQLQLITSPYALTSDHVQGPGGNTSYKQDGQILIKASGFTFNDVANDSGVVLLNNQAIVDNLLSKVEFADTILENTPPQIVGSIPDGLKPSMEFEFHSILKKYVLHTHSVYANVIACSAQCTDILGELFDAAEYTLVPYVTPGFPIAASLLINNEIDSIPAIIFLKNHGIIIHGDDAAEVVELYNTVQAKIMAHFQLQTMAELALETAGEDVVIINSNELSKYQIDVDTAVDDLMTRVLIPDQSIFFRGKVSADEPNADIYLDKAGHQIVIRGSQKFIKAAKAMFQAVYYIRNNIAKSGLTPDYIPFNKIQEMHGLSTEKYRTQILKK